MKSQPVYLFTHVPNTGGLSFSKRVFNSSFSEDEQYSFLGLRRFLSQNHQGHRLIYGHFPYGMNRLLPFRQCKSVSILRDPVDRAVSEYHHARQFYGALVRSGSPIEPAFRLAGELSLEDYCCANQNVQTMFLAGFPFWPASKRFIKLASSRNVLDIALKNLQQNYSFVGLMERFEDSVRLFSWQENLKAQPVFETKSTTGRPRLAEIDETILESIRSSNQLDIELYDRASKLFADKFQQFQSGAD